MIHNFFCAYGEENLYIFTLNRTSKKFFQINDVSQIYLPIQSPNPELSYEDFKYLKYKLYGKISIKKVLAYSKNSMQKEEFYFVFGIKNTLYWLCKAANNELMSLMKLVIKNF